MDNKASQSALRGATEATPAEGIGDTIGRLLSLSDSLEERVRSVGTTFCGQANIPPFKEDQGPESHLEALQLIRERLERTTSLLTTLPL